jgi:hydroxymethylpyrimidine/phosphomethylpyrimidine kinase
VIIEQIRTAFAARRIAAIKIGMLGCGASLDAVVIALSNARCPIVLDPVLAASSGRTLLEEAALVTLRRELLPRATLLTPNVFEAAALLQVAPALDEAARVAQGQALLELGAQAVLMKAGHVQGATATDLLLTASGTVERLVGVRVAATLRGTGCMLAAAITAGLVLHKSLLEACVQGKQFVAAQLLSLQSQ